MKKEMKKNLFMVAAVALMAMISCNKEEINNIGEPQEPQTPEVVEPSYYVEFTADLAADDAVSTPAQQSAATKTTYDATNKKTKWVAGDLIAVNGKKFEIKEVLNGGLSARFVNAEELGEDFNPPYTAVYPYDATAGQAVVPSTQTVSDGTFADEAVVAVGYSADDNVLSFKHVCSVIKFTVSTSGLTELEFSSEADLAGTINVNANAGADPTYSVASGSKTITVKPASGTFSTTATYYVSVLPTLGAATVKQKLEIKTEGVVVKSGNVHFNRNKIMDAKAIEVKYTYLKPNANWLGSNARFAAYFFEGEKNEWVDMTSVDGVYRCVVPEGYSNLLYGRMNPSSQTNGFTQNTQIWNQTKDLTVQTGTSNCYVVHIEQWSKEDGLWTSVDEAKRILYLLPQAEWDKDNARFAAYFFGNGEMWKDMTKFTTYKYYVIPPAGYPTVIFCRMNGGATANNWNNKWNQTVDLTIPTNGNNTCTISNFWSNKASGSWSKK